MAPARRPVSPRLADAPTRCGGAVCRRPMILKLRSIGHRLYRLAEHLLVAMIAVMFVAFVVQVASRYVFGWPTGSTSELTVVCWLWLVLFGAAFVVREEEEIRFELLYAAVGNRTRRVMIFIAAVALICLYGWSLPAVVDYVSFMRVEHTAYLKIRFDWLYSIYVVFAAATIARYLWLAWSALTQSSSAEFDPDQGGVRRMSLASPFSLSHRRDYVALFVGTADRPRHDRGFHSLSLACRSRHGHCRRAVAQRHVCELHHPRRAHVHPRRGADERRLHDGTAAQFLQCRGRTLQGRPGAGQRRCRASSSPACRARPSPMRRAPAR